MLSIVRHSENAISLIAEETQDSRQANSDLFSLHASEYIEAATDRRKLWLDNSRIKLDVQRELAKMPIDTFSDTTKDPGDLLGMRATIRLTQELDARLASQTYKMSEVTLKAVSNFKQPAKSNNNNNQSSNRPKNTPKKKKPNNNSGARNEESQPFRGGDSHPRGGQRGGRRQQRGRNNNNNPKKGNFKKGSTD